MGTLGRYIIVEVIRNTFLVLLCLLGVFLFFDLIQEFASLGRGSYSLLRMAIYVLLRAPGHAYELLPIAVLIGGLFALSLLNQNSEYTVMRVGGLSVGRVLANLCIGGSFFALLTLLSGEYLAPVAERAASQLRLAATGQVVAQDFRSGFWTKDGQSFINVHEVLPDNTLRGINIYEFDSARTLRSITRAENGRWDRGYEWKLSSVIVTRFQPNQVWIDRYMEYNWRSVISPDTLAVLLIVPAQMSASSLVGYIEHLRKNHQKTSRFEIALWSKLFYPLACLSMLIIALPFAQTQRRAGGIGAKLVVGIMLGLGFYFINKLVGHLGLLYDWSPLAAATLPSAAFLLVAVFMLWMQERR